MTNGYSDANGRELKFGQALAEGKEGVVYPVLNRTNTVAKIFKGEANEPGSEQERKDRIRKQAEKIEKVVAMVGQNLDGGSDPIYVAWPKALVYLQGEVVGYLMPNIRDAAKILWATSPRLRKQKFGKFHWRELHHVAQNLALAFAEIHACACVIGDVNLNNILINGDAGITLIDSDSFQVRGRDGKVYPCTPVGVPEFTPPELAGSGFGQGRTEAQDLFGLGTMIFLLLMEGHYPFSAKTALPVVPEGQPDIYCKNQGIFPHSARVAGFEPPPAAPPFASLHSEIQAFFVRCFETGFHDPGQRPSAMEWAAALGRAVDELAPRNHNPSCPKNPDHDFFREQGPCPWCAKSDRIPVPGVPRQKPLSSLPPRPVARQSQPFRVSAAALWVIGLTSAGALGWSVLNRTNVVPTMGGPGAATLAVSSGQAPTASGPGNEADKLYQQGKQLGKSSNPKDRKQGVEMLRQAAKLGSSAARALVTKQSMPFGRLPAKELPSPVGTAPSHASDPQTENPAAEDRPGRFVSIYDN